MHADSPQIRFRGESRLHKSQRPYSPVTPRRRVTHYGFGLSTPNAPRFACEPRVTPVNDQGRFRRQAITIFLRTAARSSASVLVLLSVLPGRPYVSRRHLSHIEAEDLPHPRCRTLRACRQLILERTSSTSTVVRCSSCTNARRSYFSFIDCTRPQD